MKSKILFIAFAALVYSQAINAQEGMPIYADYLSDNYYLIHPSMAGAANCAKIRVTARQQWFGQDDAPKLLTMSVNSKLGESQSALGAIVYADNNGYHSQKGGYVTYAHHLMFSRSVTDLNMLSFGLSAGFIQYQLDETEFNNDLPVRDPIIGGIVQSETNFNLDFGFSYHYLDFYAHATVKNLLNNPGVNNDLQITSNLRRFLLSAGYVYNKFGSSWAFEPSVLYQFKSGTKESIIDINAKAYKSMDFGQFWAGISYRQSLDGAEYLTDSGSISSQKLNQITPIVGVNYNKFMFAYTYTYQTNDVVLDNSGFHQLSIGYNFNCAAKRYECHCPAVN
ncbi:type IX secretion system membrane protein PorP/SprF [Tamlana agarivorans]|uniref:Type IX secretion system membrane protein PorP/SprF n=1 Tax=Pseudotamlana agarivorans TaxID=481183 RepID=A0ACC5U8I4_9FLAO|nr:type IX secretion system membrane protein PorP/SprF [Tamlana agarivorans]MBU2950569.1 type IX secretion system membrane protein PorP/SprF [Tamlana agarivorans]